MLRWLRQVRVWAEPTATVEGDSRPVWRRLAVFIGIRRDF